MGDQTQAYDIFQTPLSSGYPLPLKSQLFLVCIEHLTRFAQVCAPIYIKLSLSRQIFFEMKKIASEITFLDKIEWAKTINHSTVPFINEI